MCKLFGKPGETVCLVGESGSGKTSILKGILGLLGENGRVTGGELLFQGQNLATLSPAEYRQLRGKKIAMSISRRAEPWTRHENRETVP